MIVLFGPPPREGGGASGRWPVADQISALHESAHACAALAARMELRSVELHAVRAGNGTSTLHGRAIYALAGAAMTRTLGSGMSDTDHNLLKRVAVEAGVDPWHPQWRHDADRFVEKHRADIRRLAVVLLERRYLTGDEAVAALGDRWRPRPVQPVRLAP